MPAPPWVLRSLLFVPGSRPAMFAKAAASGADAIILDLEDGVAPEAKPGAREHVAAAFAASRPAGPLMFVRVNGAESGLLGDDVARALRPGVDAVCLPKCEGAEYVHALDLRLRRAEAGWSIPPGTIRVIPMIETAKGVVQATAIAQADGRVAALGFGAEDFTADLGVSRTRHGEEVRFARAATSIAAHAAGVVPLDGIFADFRDPEGLRADVEAARTLGYKGKMLIHPAQVSVVHEAFAPSARDVEHARRVVAAFEEAEARGDGIAVVDGAMVDRPVAVRARRLLEIALERP